MWKMSAISLSGCFVFERLFLIMTGLWITPAAVVAIVDRFESEKGRFVPCVTESAWLRCMQSLNELRSRRKSLSLTKKLY